VTTGRLPRPTLPAAAALAVLAAAAGCQDRSPRPPAAVRSSDVRRMSPPELQAFAADGGIAAGAKAGQEAVARHEIPPAPPAPLAPPAPNIPTTKAQGPAQVVRINREGADVSVTVSATKPARAGARTGTPPVISLTGIKSDKPYPSKERATEDALTVAQMELTKALQKLDPPVTAKPSLSTIRSEYVRRDGVREVQPSAEDRKEWAARGLDPNRVWVTVDVEVSESQVNNLRAGERVNTAFHYGAVVFAGLLAAYGFLRLDAWTKGYLTSWLALGAVAVVVLALLAVVA